jgi:arabinogalactan endo-1,4-beta-galactosidase
LKYIEGEINGVDTEIVIFGQNEINSADTQEVNYVKASEIIRAGTETVKYVKEDIHSIVKMLIIKYMCR